VEAALHRLLALENGAVASERRTARTKGGRMTIAVKMLEPLKAEAAKRRNQAAGSPQGVKSVPPEPVGQKGEAVAEAARIVGVAEDLLLDSFDDSECYGELEELSWEDQASRDACVPRWGPI
jgi:hypothetical protein